MPIAAIGFTAAMTVAAASTAISVAATIQQTLQAKKQAESQKKAQEEANKQTKLNAVAAYKDLDAEQTDVQRRQIEGQIENQKQVAEAKGQAIARTGATGAGNISSLIGDINRTGGENIGVLIENRNQSMASIRQKTEGIKQQAIAGQDVTPIQQPSWISAGLSIAGSAAQGYSDITASPSGGQ